ncbi:CRE_HP_G0097420.mRNA.1.CDS.1 [Saccharomyces cerevisiae]|nr:CRE_HP_G0097420.mRNA.1.CDS.1 [Saccharomyces cerevisiae]CAI6943668.1 CRE_HP_G0097420.mRNA.1.CDS.1 [Saccharomyces cerevisiae]
MDIEPTFKGYIEDEDDALLILQATLDGKLKHIPRRPYEIERPYLIVSGSIFVFIEEISGIKRWTDGVSWSPSRISGKFLIYKELDKENAGSNANATSSGSTDSAVITDGTSGARNNPSSSKIKLPPLKNHQFDLPPTMGHSSFESEQDTSISPSNRSNLPLKYTGLVKKTISVKLKRPPFNSIENLHIVSYYSVKDIKQNCLVTPKASPFLKDVRPSQELIVAMGNTTLGNVKNNSTTNGNGPNNINNKSNSSTPLNTVISTNNNSANINAAGSNQFTSANKNYYYKNDESSGYPITQFAPALPSTTLMYTANPPYITQSPDNTNATGMNTHVNNNNNNSNNSSNSNNNNNNNNINNINNVNTNAGNGNNPNRFHNASFAYNTTGDFINPQQQGQISYPFYYTTIPINNPNYYTTQPPNPITNASTNENQGYSTSSTQHPYYGHPTESQSASAAAGATGAPGTAENVLPVSSMQPLLHQANNNSASSATSTAPYPVYSMNVNVPYYNSSASAYKRAQENTTSNTNAEPSGATSTNSGTMLSNPAYANSQYTPSQVYYQGYPQYAMASAQNPSMYQHQHQHPLPTVYPIATPQQNIMSSGHTLSTIGSDPQHHHYQQEPNDHKNFAMGHANNNILNITNNDTMNNLNTNTSTTTQ